MDDSKIACVPDPVPQPEFDEYADDYARLMDTALESGGESAEYFAEYKLRCLRRLNAPIDEPILDFGAGTGSLTKHLTKEFSDVTAFEPSGRSLRHAKQNAPSARCVGEESELVDGKYATAVCAGVLHHIPPNERVNALQRLRRKLRPGGRLFVFEHNPWNPVTRRVVRMCAFDHNAVLLWPGELKKLLATAGFGVERQDYIVFFPRALAGLRRFEPSLRRLFLGAQTMTIAVQSG